MASSNGSTRSAGPAASACRVALRVNPDIDARSHQHISTGLKTTKFGIALDEVRDIARKAARRVPAWRWSACTAMSGRRSPTSSPLRRAAEALVTLARELRDDRITIEHLDLGGGLGISYDGSPAPTATDYAAALLPAVRDSGLSIILEPGRSIVGPAGGAGDVGGGCEGAPRRHAVRRSSTPA